MKLRIFRTVWLPWHVPCCCSGPQVARYLRLSRVRLVATVHVTAWALHHEAMQRADKVPRLRQYKTQWGCSLVATHESPN